MYAVSVRAKPAAIDAEVKEDIAMLFHATAVSTAWLLKTRLVPCA
jgi:hypothetical protein